LLFYRLFWRDLDELVSVMERGPGYSMETLYEQCESQLYQGIGEEQRDKEKRNIYDAG